MITLMEVSSIMKIVWLAVFILALGLEIMTTELVSVWFCLGALVAMVVSFIPDCPFWVSLLVFAVVSLAFLILIRPFAARAMGRKKSRSNIDQLIGEKGFALGKITKMEKGEIKIHGAIWYGFANDEEPIEIGDEVKVISIQGNKLFVVKVKE